MIPALRNRERPADGLLHPRPETLAHPINLHARIVHVELACDRVAGPLQQRRDAVAERGAPAMPDVKRTGRIGGNELDVDASALPEVVGPVASARLDDGTKRRRQLVRGEPEVDEPGAGNLGLLDHPWRELQRLKDPGGDGARRGLLHPGQDHGQVGGHIPVPGVLRPLQHEFGLRLAQFRGHPRERLPQCVTHSAAFLDPELDFGAASLEAFGSAFNGLALSDAPALTSGFGVAGAAPSPVSAFRAPLPSLP